MAKDPGIILSKKKKKETGKKKKPLKRPLLTVAKKDGEYTVTMETMKAFSKPRALNQHPYEDKPLVIYTIGRTEEENLERRKRKEREHRRLQRDQRAFIQSAFTDMCKEICLKTYQQALGFLPDAEDPDCFCAPNLADSEELRRSCSCSEHDVSFGSDTDSDEWLVEFTPPNAHFDPTYKGKKSNKQDNGSQYTYLDYRVKLLDRSGNQVTRFFKGPDGKIQCSDLGGFWSPDHKWLEINVDGYIGPDQRWAPMTFTGPQGDQIECETGKFQDTDGTWLVVGVDGYIDASGKWKFNNKSKVEDYKKDKIKKKVGDNKVGDDKAAVFKSSNATWSCFGDTNAKYLSKLGILGHGHDKRLLLQTLNEMLNQGQDVKIPEPLLVPRVNSSKRAKRRGVDTFKSFYSERNKCRHPVPSDKGIVAVDSSGNKIYFRLKDYKNKRPSERIAHLTGQGISLSSFHVPCLSSFINAEMMKKQQYKRFLKNKPEKAMEYGTSSYNKNASTQYKYRYAI